MTNNTTYEISNDAGGRQPNNYEIWNIWTGDTHNFEISKKQMANTSDTW